MDLTEMLSKLCTDLKMTLNSEISTAEGTRCIERAVDVLSRKIPREYVYEHTWIESVVDDSFTTPAATDTDKIVAAWDISAVVAGNTATLATKWMDVPRPVKLTITDANDSITSFTLIVKGTDGEGKYVEERFYRRGGKTQTGKIYFYTITEVEMNAISGNGAGDVLNLGTDAGTLWVQLSYPIKPDSEYIYSGALKTGTKYTKDTDYHMDYTNGKIQIISTGTMLEGTTYYATYLKDQVTIDISDIIPDLIRIIKVVYPVGKIPEQSVGYSIWGNKLTITAQRQGVGQTAIKDKDHLAIHYEARHAPPTSVGSGSYPELLDEVVLIGAAGYALEIEALQYELQAVTDLASLRTELGLTTAVHTAIVTALNKAATLLTATTGKIDIALTKVALYLETNGTTDNTKAVLAAITDNIAELRTKIFTAQNAVASALGLVNTTSLDKADVGAEPLLDTGVATINALNTGGSTVPSHYADYARTRANIAQIRVSAAQGYAQEVQARLNTLLSYVQEASGWTAMGDTFIAEAQALIGQVNSCIGEGQTRLAQIDRYLSEAGLYQQAAEGSMILSDRYRAESQSRLNEFRRVLETKSEYRRRVASTSVRQPA
jgi:hypothetical protein